MSYLLMMHLLAFIINQIIITEKSRLKFRVTAWTIWLQKQILHMRNACKFDIPGKHENAH